MDEQLKRELQEALYGALASIYKENNNNKQSQNNESQDKEIKIVVTGDSLSLIKAISEDDTLNDKIAKISDSFSLLNDQLRKFEEMKVMGPEGSFTNLVNFIAAIASIPNLDNLKKFTRDDAVNVTNFMKEITTMFNDLEVGSVNTKLPDVGSVLKFIDFVTSDEWIQRVIKANKNLTQKNIDNLRTFFYKVAAIFDDEKIKKVFFETPGEGFKGGEGIYALVSLLNFVSDDKFIKKITKANIAMRLGAASAIKKFFTTLGSIYEVKSIKEIKEEQIKSVNSLIKLIESVSSVNFLFRVTLASMVLDEKKGKSIASFFNGFVENLTKVRQRDFDKSIKVLESINSLIKTLTVSILVLGVLSLVIASTRPFTTIMVMGTIVFLQILLIKSILKNAQDLKSKEAHEAIKAMSDLINALTWNIVAIAAVGVLIKMIGFEPILESLAVFAIVIGGLLLISFILKGTQETIQKGKEGAEGLAILVLAIGATMLLLTFTAMLARNLDFEGLAIVGGILLVTMLFGILLHKWWEKEGTPAMEGIIGLLALITGIGLNIMLLAITALMVKKVSLHDWLVLAGLVLLELLVFGAIGLAHKRGLIGKDAIEGVVELIALATGITLNVLLLVLAARAAHDIEYEDLGKLALLIGGEILILGVLFGAAKYLKGKDQILANMAILEGLLIGISANALLAVAAVNAAKDVTQEAILKFIEIIGAEIAIGVALAKVSKIAKNIKTDLFIMEALLGGLALIGILTAYAARSAEKTSLAAIGKFALILAILTTIGAALGALGYFASSVLPAVAIIELLLGGLLVLGLLTAKVAKDMQKTSVEDVIHIGKVLGALELVLIAMGAVGFLAPLMLPIVAPLELLLFGLICVISKMVDVVKKYNDSGMNIEEKSKEISKGIGGFMTSLAGVFGNPIYAAYCAAISLFITATFTPMLFTISKFVDIIVKVATMNFLSGYDENGKPMYEKVDPSVFGKAAAAVTTGFTNFIEGLKKSFSDLNVIALFLVGIIGETMTPIVDTVGKFVDAVLKLATSTYIVGYDDNGKPIFEHTDPAMFSKAAEVITQNFGKFLSTLIEQANKLGFWSDDALEAIGDNIKPIMDGISTFADAIVKLATGAVVKEYDEKGHPIYRYLTEVDYENAATVLTSNFGTFLKKLIEETKNLRFGYQEDALETMSETIEPIMKGISSFVDAIVKLASGTYIKDYDDNGKPIYERLNPHHIGHASRQLIMYFSSFMRTLINDMKGLEDEQLEAIESVSQTMGPLMSSIGSFADAILKLATGQYVIGYDDNGKEKYARAKPLDYMLAAATLVASFDIFITTLRDKFGTVDDKSADVINKLTKGGLKDLMDCISKFSKILLDQQFLIEGYDDNGKPIFMKDKDGNLILASSKFREIAKNIGDAFITFIDTINTGFETNGLKDKIVEISATFKDIQKIFGPINDFTKALKTASEAEEKIKKDANVVSLEQFGINIANSLLGFLKALTEGDGNNIKPLSTWATEEMINMFKNAKESVSIVIDTVLLLKKLTSINIEDINKNIDQFHVSIEKLLNTDFTKNVDSFANNVDRFKTIMENLRSETYGLTSISANIDGSVNLYLQSTTRTVTSIIRDLTRFDNKIIATMNKVAQLRNGFEESIDKIEGALKKNENDRNKMLTDLTNHLDTIGNKLRIISDGLTEISKASFDNVTKLAEEFARMQAEVIQQFVDANAMNMNNQYSTPEYTPNQPDNSQSTYNNYNNLQNNNNEESFFNGKTIRFVFDRSFNSVTKELTGSLKYE